jgi:hypothetical protein
MGQLDLQHALAGSGALAEDLEDQPGAIQHLGAGFLFQVALLDRVQGGIDEQELDLLLLGPPGNVLDMPAADEGRRLDLAHLGDLGEHDLDTDGAGQAFELGLAGFDAMGGGAAADVGNDQADAGRGATLVYECLRAALAGGLVVELIAQSRSQSSLVCSGSNSWIGAPGMMVEMACL